MASDPLRHLSTWQEARRKRRAGNGGSGSGKPERKTTTTMKPDATPSRIPSPGSPTGWRLGNAKRPGLFDRLQATLVVPIVSRFVRVMIGKNLPSLARWMTTAAGAALVTAGLLTPEALGDGFQFGEIGMAIAGLGLMLESRINNWLRGRNVYGINLSPVTAVVGRSFSSFGRWVVNVLSTYLVTVGAVDAAPAALEGLGLDAVLLGVLGWVATRIWSYAEAWMKRELPEDGRLDAEEALFDDFPG